MISDDGFKLFGERVKDSFPCNSVPVTRNSCHTKWLLVSCERDPRILFHHGKHCPLLTSTMSAEAVQHLVVSEEAVPLPPAFCLVMDTMHCWGRSVSGHWHNKTLELFSFYFGLTDMIALARTDLFFDVIQMRVLQIINYHFPVGNGQLHDSWRDHCDDMINSGKTGFFELAMGSIHHANRELDALLGL